MKRLVQDPRSNVNKILPFIKSKITPLQRGVYEFFGSEKYSTPYPGHKKLSKYINKKNGFFVQSGGNDGYGFDPTYYLEKILGWEGIIAEPLSVYVLCKRNRPRSAVYNCATGSFDNVDKTISFVDCNLMSFVKDSIDNQDEWIEAGESAQSIKSEIITVPIKPVQELIDDYFKNTRRREIDLFVIDTEGYELQVLEGLNFSLNAPEYILVEAQNPDRFKIISNFLLNKKYSFIDEIGEKDYLFIKDR